MLYAKWLLQLNVENFDYEPTRFDVNPRPTANNLIRTVGQHYLLSYVLDH